MTDKQSYASKNQMKVSIRNGFAKHHSSPSPCIQVVIDVFRASTTALALLKVGVHELVVANDLEVIKDFHKQGFKVISEVFDLGIDNSPTLVLTGNYDGQKTILKTSNLTLAISENYSPSKMLIGAFNNVSALTRYITQQSPFWVEIIPAGSMKLKQENTEDNECAYLLKALLERDRYSPDWRAISEKVNRKISEKAKPLFYIDDLKHALNLDITSIVPVIEKRDVYSFSVRPQDITISN